MKPRISLWIIAPAYLLLTSSVAMVGMKNNKEHLVDALVVTLLSALWAAVLIARHMKLLRAMNKKQAVLSALPEMQAGLLFASVDGRSAIGMNTKRRIVAIVDTDNNVAICKQQDIRSCELEVDKLEGVNHGGVFSWFSFIGGFSSTSMETYVIKSVTLYLVVNNLDVSSVNVYFMKNRKHRRATGRYAEALEIARKWEDKMAVFMSSEADEDERGYNEDSHDHANRRISRN